MSSRTQRNPRRGLQQRRAFTLTEILVVLGIVTLLSAILLPALGMVRESGRRAACASTLRQLGLAMQQYTADYERYPRGLDFADKNTPEIWNGIGVATPQLLADTPLINDVMATYVASPNVWKCPSDSGMDYMDITGLPLDGRPSCAEKFGMSYIYRTEVTLFDLTQDALPRPAETNILMDASGDWHGRATGTYLQTKRYNVLFADGHVKNLDHDAFIATWDVPLVP